MHGEAEARSRFWPAGLIVLAVYLVGFGLIRMNCETMLSGSGIHMLALPKPLRHSPLNWHKPLPRLLISAYLPLFWADVKLTKRMYFSTEGADIPVVPWP